MSDDLIERLERHVRDRSGPVLTNGAWAMMLEAAARIRELETRLATARNDALEEAKQAVIAFGKQNKMPGEIPYERAVAAEDIADIIEALKSETKP